MAFLNIKKLGGALFNGLNPFDGGQGFTSAPTAQQKAAASIQSANQKIQNMQNPRGVLANPQVRQRFVQNNQAPNYSPIKVGISALTQAPGKTLPAMAVGAARSLTGTGEGFSGLYDLATPGTGTNRFTKDLVQYGANIDKFAKDKKLDQGAYKVGQATTEAASFLAPSAAAKVAGRAGTIGKVISSAEPLLDVKALKYISSPATWLNTAVGTTRAQGSIAAKGQDVGLKTVVPAATANLALGGVLNVGGAKIADPIKKAMVKVRSDAPSTRLDAQIAAQKTILQDMKAAEMRAKGSAKQTLSQSTLNQQQKLNVLKAQKEAIVQGGYAQVPGKSTVKLKERGFTKNLKNANEIEQNPRIEEVISSIPGYRKVSNRETLGKAAGEINRDPSGAYARIATKPQLSTAQDVATGQLLLRQAVASDDIEAAIQIGTKLGMDGTKLGQAVQAYSMWSRTTPEGIIKYASKQAQQAGKELDPAITRDLVAQAKKIQSMPDSLEKAKATQALLSTANQIDRTWKNTAQEVISAPRSLMATADLSAPLRQGAVLGSRYPGKFAKNFGESVKYFFNPGAYEKSMYEISQRPNYSLMKSHKLAVDGARGLTGTEEQFMSSILEGKTAKKLGIGHLVAASDRAYTGFLTKLRADVFDHVVKQSSDAGVNLDRKALDSLSKFINSASGRGSGKNLDKYGGLLSQALFSPRLWKSRIDTLNPAYYARLDPQARKLALQSAASFAAITSTILGLAKASGADVETDPRSADFAKVKVGNTRYDILGGHQQQARFAAQMITGQKINSETGEIQTLGPDRGFGKPSRLDLAYQFVENKENPVVGFATKALRGTDPAGNKINLASEAAKLGIPLNIQQTYETARDQGSIVKGAAMNLPGTFGIGVQTYGQKNSPTIKSQAPKTTDKGYTLQQNDKGEYEYTIGDKKRTTTDLKDAQMAIAKDSFKKSGKVTQVLGDNVLRLKKDGGVQVTSRLSYDYSLTQNKLQSAKKSDNMEEWFKLANSQYSNLEQQLQDPTLDELEKSNIQEKMDNLLADASKYQSYGGFSKSKGGSSKSVGSAYKYSISSGVAGSAPKVQSAPKVASNKYKVSAKSSSKPKVTIKKSKV